MTIVFASLLAVAAGGFDLSSFGLWGQLAGRLLHYTEVRDGQAVSCVATTSVDAANSRLVQQSRCGNNKTFTVHLVAAGPRSYTVGNTLYEVGNGGEIYYPLSDKSGKITRNVATLATPHRIDVRTDTAVDEGGKRSWTRGRVWRNFTSLSPAEAESILAGGTQDLARYGPYAAMVGRSWLYTKRQGGLVRNCVTNIEEETARMRLVERVQCVGEKVVTNSLHADGPGAFTIGDKRYETDDAGRVVFPDGNDSGGNVRHALFMPTDGRVVLQREHARNVDGSRRWQADKPWRELSSIVSDQVGIALAKAPVPVQAPPTKAVAVASAAAVARPAPAISTAQAADFGIWAHMMGSPWKSTIYRRAVEITCFHEVTPYTGRYTFPGRPGLHPLSISRKCEDKPNLGGKVYSGNGDGSFSDPRNRRRVVLEDGSYLISDKDYTDGSRRRKRLVLAGPDRIERVIEDGKAGRKDPRWKLYSREVRYERSSVAEMKRVLAAGPARVAEENRKMLPRYWDWMLDFPRSVDIGMVANVDQRELLNPALPPSPSMLVLRTVEWIKPNDTLRLDYLAADGRKWTDEIKLTDNGLELFHYDRTGKKKLDLWITSSAKEARFEVGKLSCGDSQFYFNGIGSGSAMTLNETFVTTCRGGEYEQGTSQPYRAPSTVGEYARYSPQVRDAFQTQLATRDAEFEAEARQYLASQKRAMIEEREFARREAENKARMRAIILNGIANIGQAVAQGRADAQRRAYETEQVAIAYATMGIVEESRRTGRTLNGYEFSQALDRATAGIPKTYGYGGGNLLGAGSYSGSGSGSDNDEGDEDAIDREAFAGGGPDSSEESFASSRPGGNAGSRQSSRDSGGDGAADYGNDPPRDGSQRMSGGDRYGGGDRDGASSQTPSGDASSGSASASSGGASLVVKDNNAEWRRQQAEQRASREAQEAREREYKAQAEAAQRRALEEAIAKQAEARAKYEASDCAKPDVHCVTPQ